MSAELRRLILSAESHRKDRDWELMILDLREAAALAATPAQPTEVERWGPIETAPKDGTVVLLGRHMGNFGFVRGYGHFDGKPGVFLSGWISTGFDPVMSNLGLAHPTHWAPLPTPPALSTEGGGNG